MNLKFCRSYDLAQKSQFVAPMPIFNRPQGQAFGVQQILIFGPLYHMVSTELFSNKSFPSQSYLNNSFVDVFFIFPDPRVEKHR